MGKRRQALGVFEIERYVDNDEYERRTIYESGVRLRLTTAT
jgi:hypothetical protein